MDQSTILDSLEKWLNDASAAQNKAQSSNEIVFHRAEKETLMKVIALIKEA